MARRLTKAQQNRDLQIHQTAISNYANGWLKYFGFKIGSSVVPKRMGQVQTKIDPRQLNLFSTVKPMRGEVTGIVCFGSRSMILVRLEGERESYAYPPEVWKNELDMKP